MGSVGTPAFDIGDALVARAVGGARGKELVAEARSGGWCLHADPSSSFSRKRAEISAGFPIAAAIRNADWR